MTPADTQDAATTLTRSDRADLLVEDPLAQFDAWLAEAHASEINDANAMTLATVDAGGVPDARIVLLKGVDGRGFVFYTNTRSAKGEEIGAVAQAALIFHWKSLRRQVRVRGPVERVTDGEADAYYASRPRGSRIGAWASQQSRPLDSRATLEAAVAEVERRFPGEQVPRPPHWSGYRIVPLAMEFWRDGASRLHDRAQFTRVATQDGWSRTRLYP